MAVGESSDGGEHPTRVRLLDATVALLDDVPAEHLTATSVLDRCGVSVGSLYHHFASFPDLVAQAVVVRFVRTNAADLRTIEAQHADAVDAADWRRRTEATIRRTHAADRAAARAQRVQAMSVLAAHPTARSLLARVQQRLIDDLAAVIADARDRGWTRADVDPSAVATLAQALTLGRSVDDVTERPLDPDVWTEMVVRIFSSLLFD